MFIVRADTLKAARAVNVTTPAGATAIINVIGDRAEIRNATLTLSGTSSDRVAINIATTTTLTVADSFTRGAIIAPYAATPSREPDRQCTRRYAPRVALLRGPDRDLGEGDVGG